MCLNSHHCNLFCCHSYDYIFTEIHSVSAVVEVVNDPSSEIRNLVFVSITFLQPDFLSAFHSDFLATWPYLGCVIGDDSYGDGINDGNGSGGDGMETNMHYIRTFNVIFVLWWLGKMVCKTDEYYDSRLRDCRQCSLICDPPYASSEHQEECLSNCPGRQLL